MTGNPINNWLLVRDFYQGRPLWLLAPGRHKKNLAAPLHRSAPNWSNHMHCRLNMATTGRLLHLTTSADETKGGSRYKLPGPGCPEVTYVCVFLGGIIIYSLYILTLSDQNHFQRFQFYVKILTGPPLLREGGEKLCLPGPDPLSAASLRTKLKWPVIDANSNRAMKQINNKICHYFSQQKHTAVPRPPALYSGRGWSGLPGNPDHRGETPWYM